MKNPRDDALFNGALIALGAMAILDNVIAHWILELHRAVPGPYALEVEIGLVIVGADNHRPCSLDLALDSPHRQGGRPMSL